jgi:hypothetical protein
MTENARRKVERAEKRNNKKRKAGDAAPGNKKKTSKKNSNGETLKSVCAKDAQVRAGGCKTIFTQPPNLADGCFLKDYQLEGVRWLASLFENGVSGILADEVSSFVRWKTEGLHKKYILPNMDSILYTCTYTCTCTYTYTSYNTYHHPLLLAH